MRILGSMLLLLATSAPAFAGLGGNATPVAPAQPQAGTVLRAQPARGYTVQEFQTGDGVTIREYVSPAGKVFGVVWSGPRMPDLQQLFGNYFEAFRDELRARQPHRGPLNIERPDLVIQSGGHPRAFRGRAFLPDQLPAGVSADEIR
jgi:hypothetical protein